MGCAVQRKRCGQLGRGPVGFAKDGPRHCAALPTRKLAQRRLDLLLAHINSIGYRPGKSASFAEFVELWRERILKMQKPWLT